MTKSDLAKKKIWCIIPVYNNGNTVANVVVGCKKQVENIVVVDDGSTDIDVSLSVADEQVIVIKHERNEGKGSALMT
ncbi:MAG: glycosyltransferase, partial [Planctomycetes bacterium]|nr:glycosyltransferase [Planctomycetota bacterium]